MTTAKEAMRALEELEASLDSAGWRPQKDEAAFNTLRSFIKDSKSENAHLRLTLSKMVKAWEVLPEGHYVLSDIDGWINGPMVKAINNCRKVLGK